MDSQEKIAEEIVKSKKKRKPRKKTSTLDYFLSQV